MADAAWTLRALSSEIVELWLLRLLVRLGCVKAAIKAHGFKDDDLADAIDAQLTVKEMIRQFRARHLEAERRVARGLGPRLPAVLERILQRVGDQLWLLDTTNSTRPSARTSNAN